MIGWLKHPMRVTGRLCWVAGALLLAAFCFTLQSAFRPAASATRIRAAWLQQTTRRLLRIFRFELNIEGEIPSRGMLVCNHLSYIDILVFGSLAPTIFVAKREVRTWPVFGWFASLGGTIFVDREKRNQAKATTEQIQSVLDSGVLVILFPEGTSSNGETVLPFKSALLEPVTAQTHSLSVGCISYELEDGDPVEEVCYWKDMTLVPHLINLLSKRRLCASVRLAQVCVDVVDRKELAKLLHFEVVKLKQTV